MGLGVGEVERRSDVSEGLVIGEVDFLRQGVVDHCSVVHSYPNVGRGLRLAPLPSGVM